MKLNGMPHPVLGRSSASPGGPLYHGLHVSPEEYMRLEYDGHRYEMIHGVLYLAPRPLFEHNDAAGEFEHRMRIYLKQTGFGRVVRETDVALPDGGDIVAPDVSFILRERLGIVQGKIHGAPDLVCEVLSPRTRKVDLGVKARRYLACGVQEYWIVDPRERTIVLLVSKRDAGGELLWERDECPVLVSRLLPGFALEIQDFFPVV